MILILNGLLCLSSFDLGIEVVPFMYSFMKWNMRNWNWWICSSSLLIIWAVLDSTRMSSEVKLQDFSSEEETGKGDDEPEKKKRRKRERIAKMFERDGKATNLAEGWDFPNFWPWEHHLPGCRLQATLFLQSTQSRATRSMLGALQEGEQTIAVCVNKAI